jgi:hypothetical protein
MSILLDFEALGLKILVCFLVIWYFITTLVYFIAVWYYLWPCWCIIFHFGLLCQEKSGNPVSKSKLKRACVSRKTAVETGRKTPAVTFVIRVARWFILRPKIPNLGIFWWALEWKMLVHFTAVWYNL